MATAHVNRIGTAVPPHDVHQTFIDFVRGSLPDERSRRLFERMALRAEIDHRYSHLAPNEHLEKAADSENIYGRGAFAGTGARMKRYERDALRLARQACDDLGVAQDRDRITHLVVASCTGFTAPGLDQQLAAALGLAPDIERTLVGFMGCAAAVNALKVAHHIVRSDPDAVVLVVNCELCTLHMQDTAELDQILAAMLFSDGCTAALVSAEPTGLALMDFKAATIPETSAHITWHIGDSGFAMHLSGEVPSHITRALRQESRRNDGGIFAKTRPEDVELWAVHAGGRSILDAVQEGLSLDGQALRWSRGILREFGNMSSATLMFVLDRMLRTVKREAQGFGMAFGPGLVAETFRFRTVG